MDTILWGRSITLDAQKLLLFLKTLVLLDSFTPYQELHYSIIRDRFRAKTPFLSQRAYHHQEIDITFFKQSSFFYQCLPFHFLSLLKFVYFFIFLPQ